MRRRPTDAEVAVPGGPVAPGTAHPGGALPCEQATGPDPDVRSVARGGAANILSAACSAAVNVGLALLAARGVSAEAAGAFFATTSVFLIVARVCDLGSSTGLVYHLSRARALGQETVIGRYLAIGIVPIVLLATVAGAVLFVLAPLVGALIGDDPGETAGYVRAVAVFVPVAVLSDACISATRGMGSMRATALVEQVLRPLLQTALAVIAIAVGGGLALTVAWAAPYVVSAALAWWWLSRLQQSALRRHREADGAVPRPSAAGYWRLGAEEAALYTAATRFVVLGQLFGTAISFAVAPALGVAIARGDRAGAGRLFRTATTWLVLLTWPIHLGVAVLSPLLLRVFGPGYEAGTPVVVILCLAMLCATGVGSVDTVLLMAGRTTWSLGNTVLALAANIAVDLLLIPRIGIAGAAVGWATAIVIANLLALAQVSRSPGLHPFDRAWVTAAGLAAVCIGLVPAGFLWVGGGHPVARVFGLTVGVGLFAGGCWRARATLRLPELLALRHRSRLLSAGSAGTSGATSAPEGSR
jgi:O-antigen/teichoic acid export membrane protein